VDAGLDLAGAGPAPGARVFSGEDSAGAVGATDAGEAVVVEFVVGNVVLADVVPDLRLTPVDQGIDLDQLEFGVPLDGLRLFTRGGLASTSAWVSGKR